MREANKMETKLRITSISIITGKVERDIYGLYGNMPSELFIDHDKITSIFNKYEGKDIKVTIEVMNKTEEI
jgi:hypothetical protein